MSRDIDTVNELAGSGLVSNWPSRLREQAGTGYDRNRGLSYPNLRFKTTRSGGPLTLCVAGFCENGRTLVVAHDTLVTYGPQIVQPSSALLEPILNRVLPKLETIQNEVAPIIDAFTEAYRAERLKQVNDVVLARYGLTHREYISGGITVDEVRADVKEFDLGSDFLIGGFDLAGQQHLFSVVNPGIAQGFTGAGYFASGVGAAYSVNNLAFRSYSWGTASLIEALYQICESKFIGEVQNVGRDTVVTALRQHEGASFFLKGDHEIRLLTKAGRRSEAEQRLAALVQWAPLTP